MQVKLILKINFPKYGTAIYVLWLPWSVVYKVKLNRGYTQEWINMKTMHPDLFLLLLYLLHFTDFSRTQNPSDVFYSYFQKNIISKLSSIS